MSEGTKKTILVVEDDEVLGDVITRKLQASGYEAVLETDGKAGYERFTALKPDLVLLDIILPTMNGYEFLEAKQKDAAVTTIPVIVISNSGQPVEISRAVSLGVKDYLVKANFSPEDVLKKVEEQFAKGNNTAHAGALAGKKILVVEDEAFLRDLVSMKLSKEGCELLHAFDGEEALTVIKEQKPDIVLLDLVLPSMSGFDVLDHVKADPETKDIPVVILSNLGQEQDIKRGKDLGAVDFLVKANYSIDEIIERIREILGTASK